VINDPAHALEEALKLAAQGIPVFPCKETKAPATFKGFHAATRAPAEVQRLWKRFPGPLIGVPTGEASGFDVLDIDSAKHSEAVVWWMSNRQRSRAPECTGREAGGCIYCSNTNHLLAPVTPDSVRASM
jgi:Bifunctional DNA primase/polymerase, N-terminal